MALPTGAIDHIPGLDKDLPFKSTLYYEPHYVLHTTAPSVSGINTGLSIAGSSGEGESDMFQYLSTFLYVHVRNSREGKSTSGVGITVLPTL